MLRTFKKYLKPNNLFTLLWLGALRLLVFLPFHYALRIGYVGGWIFWMIPNQRRHIAWVNLRLILPNLPAKEINKLTRQCFLNIGQSVIEVAYAWWASDATISKLYVMKNVELLQAAQDHGVLALSIHSTSMELGRRIFTTIAKQYTNKSLFVMYRPTKNKIVNDVMLRARSKHDHATMLHRDSVLEFSRQLLKHNICLLVPDQDYGKRHSVFSKFFGINAATISSPIRIAKSTQAKIIFCSTHRNAQHKVVIEFIAAPENIPSDDLEHDVTIMNKILETMISQHCTQYLWQHRRFKTRPDGEHRPYQVIDYYK